MKLLRSFHLFAVRAFLFLWWRDDDISPVAFRATVLAHLTHGVIAILAFLGTVEILFEHSAGTTPLHTTFSHCTAR